MPSSPPSPERPQSEADLDFTPQRMVRWFNPLELVRAGVRAGLSTLFGAYADRRELQALQASAQSRDRAEMTTGTVRTASGDGSHEWYDLSDPESLWIDYTADLGDGFDATYTVARLLAEQRLQVGDHSTERGQVLVMGGDQVYPTASRTEYQNRLVGPYRAALPWVLEAPPLLFAVPGNHDWYDGLTSFLRLFTQGRWIGGWKTEQRRSYFAVNLPHDWWLWGIDIQLNADIDKPQLDYFRALAADDSIMPPGSKVALCTPEPSWLYAETKGQTAYQNLGYLEDKIIEPNGHELAVGLAGDLHMYARYEAAETGHQRIIAGGGGAYLYPTHDLPETLAVETAAGTHRFEMQPAPDGDSGAPVFPDVPTSRGLSWGAPLLPFKNPWFGGAVALLYLLFAWLTQSATVRPSFGAADAPGGTPSSLLSYLARTSDAGSALGAVLDATQHAPGAALLVVVLWAGLVAFADLKSWGGALVAGTLHAAAHLGLAAALMWGFAVVNHTVEGLPATGPLHVPLFVGEMAVFGGLLGGLLTGLYLILANRLLGLFGKKGVHANEVFSAQHIPHYKNFLRLHVGADGELTLYPVGISSIETHWSVRPDGGPEDPWFEGSAPLADRAELIEPPIRVGGPARRE